MLDLSNIIPIAIAFLVALTIHEFAHAWVAYKLGDPTAKSYGRLSLNPLKHIDPWGLLALFVIRIGWAKPVPVNPYNFKNPKRDMALVSLAGPGINLIFAIALIFIYSFFAVKTSQLISSVVYITAFVNVMLAVFNLIPIPPLDGYKLLQLFIPDAWIVKLQGLEQFGPFILLGLFYTTNLGAFIGQVSIGILQFVISLLG